MATEGEAVPVQEGGLGRVFWDLEPPSLLPGPRRDQGPGARGAGLPPPSPSVWARVRLLWAPPRTRRVRVSRDCGLEEGQGGLGLIRGRGAPAPRPRPSKLCFHFTTKVSNAREVNSPGRRESGPNGSDPRPLLPQAAGTSFPAENPCSFSFGGGTEVGQMKACPAPDGGGEGTE